MQDRPEDPKDPAIARLLSLGEPLASCGSTWPDYQSFGIVSEHIATLIRIAADPALLVITDEKDPRGWAPVHAWRALGQLKAQEAIEPLLCLFHEVKDNDWIIEEMPDVFALIGPVAFEPLSRYLDDESHPVYSRLVAASAITELGLAYPEMRHCSVAILAAQLQDFGRNSSGMNGVLIANLVDLGAAEHSDLILKIFTAGQVDRFIVGDWRDVQVRLKGIGEEKENAGPMLDSPDSQGSLEDCSETIDRDGLIYREPRTRPRATTEPHTRPVPPQI